MFLRAFVSFSRAFVSGPGVRFIIQADLLMKALQLLYIELWPLHMSTTGLILNTCKLVEDLYLTGHDTYEDIALT